MHLSEKPLLMPLLSGWRRNVWLGFLIIASMASNFVFACATPFAALATVSVMTLALNEALCFMLMVWLANQLVGFSFLGYPHTLDSLLWGAAIGAGAMAATLVARMTVVRCKAIGHEFRLAIVFAAAFVAYELMLVLAALTPLGGLNEFTFQILWQVFSVDAVALMVLCGLNRLACALGLAALPEKLTA